MKSQAIRSIVTAVGLAGALLGAAHAAQATASYFLQAPGSQTKTDVNGSHSATATVTLAATGGTLDVTANNGKYNTQQTTLFSNGRTAQTFKSAATNTTDGDIVQLAPAGTTATQVQSGLTVLF